MTVHLFLRFKKNMIYVAVQPKMQQGVLKRTAAIQSFISFNICNANTIRQVKIHFRESFFSLALLGHSIYYLKKYVKLKIFYLQSNKCFMFIFLILGRILYSFTKMCTCAARFVRCISGSLSSVQALQSSSPPANNSNRSAKLLFSGFDQQTTPK